MLAADGLQDSTVHGPRAVAVFIYVSATDRYLSQLERLAVDGLQICFQELGNGDEDNTSTY